MHDWLTGLVVGLGVVTCVVLTVLLVRDRVAEDRTFALLGIFELLVLLEVVVGFISLGRTDRDVSGTLFGSYLAGTVIVLPAGGVWSLTERTRAGTGVLLVAALTVLFLQLRLETIWGGAHA